MKKRVILIAAAVILLALMAQGTLAYFTSRAIATNVITTGSIEIELIEMAQTENGLVPFENLSGVMPDTEASKIVTVKNTGGNDAFIRVQVDKKITLREGVTQTPDPDMVKLDYNTDSWTLKDGCYYYNEILKSGEETEPLFTTVTFAPEMGNAYQEATVAIDVRAQATQTANNGTDPLEAEGWPEF